jgi:hypothetical protein
MDYSVRIIAGLDYAKARRGIAFLESSEDASINARTVFYELSEKHRREMLSRFEYWQRGQTQDRYFHGFNQEGHRNCFVFKRKQAGTYYRYYGFLMNPRLMTDPGYLVCILVFHAVKNTEHTDQSELNAVDAVRANPEVVRAVKRAFPEINKG